MEEASLDSFKKECNLTPNAKEMNCSCFVTYDGNHIANRDFCAREKQRYSHDLVV